MVTQARRHVTRQKGDCVLVKLRYGILACEHFMLKFLRPSTNRALLNALLLVFVVYVTDLRDLQHVFP